MADLRCGGLFPKISEIVVQFPKFLVIYEIRQVEFEYSQIFLWPLLRMCTRSGQNGPKCGQIAKKSGYVQNRGQRT